MAGENRSEHACECGLKYLVKTSHFPERDRGWFVCICGREIYRYNGGMSVVVEPLGHDREPEEHH